MEAHAQTRKVTVIPASKPLHAPTAHRKGKLRVAAYCRVSTDSEEQLNSYKAQKSYYAHIISEKEEWELAGIYADEGISGTSLKKREEFKRMIAACKRGRIDLIITKSISRFARNTVDCLNTVRMLKALGIGVIFEKENINTLTESSEFLITLFSSFAQAESESLSKNVAWGLRKSMEAGNVNIPYATFLGYRKGPDGLPEIVPEEAEVVRLIYRRYIDGWSVHQIKSELLQIGARTATGATAWHISTIMSILTNEKYCGDALLQKSYISDCISKKKKKNHGELPMYYIKDHHPAIVSRAVFQWVQEEIARRNSKRKVSEKTSQTERGKYSGKYALSERIVCGECGSRYRRVTWTSHGKKRVVWRCISRLDHGKKYCQHSATVYEESLHSAILSAVNSYLDAAEVQAETLRITEEAIQNQSGKALELSTMKARITEIHDQQVKLLDLLLEYMDDEDLNNRMQELSEEKQQLESSVLAYQSDIQELKVDQCRLNDLLTWSQEHQAGFDTYDDVLTRKLIKDITIVEANLIHIAFVDGHEADMPLPEA